MRTVLFFIAGLLIGFFVGSVINMALINLGPTIINPPEGVDMKNLEVAIASFETKHFIFPFLAHALGTFFGALTGALFVKKRSLRRILALSITLLFFIGGLIMVIILPAPMWFEVVDLVFAYLPIGWLGYKIANRFYK